MKRKLLYTFIFYILFSSLTFASPSPNLIAEGAILIEPTTKTILYSKNSHSRFYPASTTKVLTSLLLVESMDENVLITKSQDSIQKVPADSSHIGLGLGDQYSYKDGIYAIMMGSDNYVSHDMAIYNAGSIESFADKMNQKAKSLGALSSHFVNPHGYHDPHHYTTPYDLSLITMAAFNNPTLSQIAGTPLYDFKVANKNTILPLKHTAAFFKKDSSFYNGHVVAAKTGYHTPAGRTLVAKANYDGLDLVAVVMKSNNPGYFEDINKLFEYGRTNFQTTQDANGTILLENTSYSEWGKPYVESALEKGWMLPTTSSYMDATTGRTFLMMLERMFPKSLQYTFVPYALPTSLTYKINQPLDYKESLNILNHITTTLNLGTGFINVTRPNNLTPDHALTLEEAAYLTDKLSTLLLQSGPIHPGLIQ